MLVACSRTYSTYTLPRCIALAVKVCPAAHITVQLDHVSRPPHSAQHVWGQDVQKSHDLVQYCKRMCINHSSPRTPRNAFGAADHRAPASLLCDQGPARSWDGRRRNCRCRLTRTAHHAMRDALASTPAFGTPPATVGRPFDSHNKRRTLGKWPPMSAGAEQSNKKKLRHPWSWLYPNLNKQRDSRVRMNQKDARSACATRHA